MQMLLQAQTALQILNQNGFAAYVVGGCVRDSLLCRPVHDWDITTNARPDAVQRCFAGFPVIETGIKHGTVTVLIDHIPIEITTYRIDGHYSDGRHPDKISFTDELAQDLSRRDFTINALAYHPEHGVIDYFGGEKDLEKKRIVCVGDAKQRFGEDALRILRAVRFSAQLGFAIEESTGQAMRQLSGLLGKISAERIAGELCRTLTGDGAAQALLQNVHVILQILPEMQPAVGFSQHNPHHHLDVWQHTVQSVAAIKPDSALRLTMLLHDIGKPHTFTQDKNGIGHFYGHAAVSADMAAQIMVRLRLDNATQKRVLRLIAHHDDHLTPQPKLLKRKLMQLGEDAVQDLLAVMRADCLAKTPAQQREGLDMLDHISRVLEEILASEQCFCLRDLALGGNDLIDIGVTKGKRVGEILQTLLEQVIDGQVQNEPAALLLAAKKIHSQRT